MINDIIKNLIFVDCEGHGPVPTLNDSVSFEFGAVAYPKIVTERLKKIYKTRNR